MKLNRRIIYSILLVLTLVCMFLPLASFEDNKMDALLADIAKEEGSVTRAADKLVRENDKVKDVTIAAVEGGDLKALLDFFKDLEILNPRWLERLNNPNCHCEPVTDVTGVAIRSPWTDLYRPLIRYFLQRYWLQAVSDYDLICRVKLTVSACLVIHALGGDLTQTAQSFSKEIENDADNVEAILDGAYTSPALTDVNLLSLLLS